MSEHEDSKEEMDKPLKAVPNNFTPVTIMVVVTISSI
jgi:hypothetical protein